jgi:chitin-binding protein
MKPTMVARVAALLSPIALLGTALALASPVQAHGYVSGPYSRAAACKMGLNTNCGGIVYEPQSLEAPKGFPLTGPADGRIASAGTGFTELDQQSYGRWYKNNISTGPMTINWTYTAAHRTSQWSYYMTKQNWDPNASLKRTDLELVSTIAHDGSAANTKPAHSITVPANRSGYHVILAIWDVADTTNAFYNVIDVNVSPGSSDSSAPSAPSKLVSSGATSSSVDLTWAASTDNVGVTGYTVLRDGVNVGTSATNSYKDLGLASGRTYSYTVRANDAAGNTSAASPSIAVTTVAGVVKDTQAPTAPGGLHSMIVTESSVDLMWSASTDNVGVASYSVLRDGAMVGQTSATSYLDSGRAPGVTYRYEVLATDAAGNSSSRSTPLTVATKALAATTGSTSTGSASPASWSATARYRVGDLVTNAGSTYRCIQAHQGYGDPNWILAPSLWSRVS